MRRQGNYGLKAEERNEDMKGEANNEQRLKVGREGRRKSRKEGGTQGRKQMGVEKDPQIFRILASILWQMFGQPGRGPTSISSPSNRS